MCLKGQSPPAQEAILHPQQTIAPWTDHNIYVMNTDVAPEEGCDDDDDGDDDDDDDDDGDDDDYVDEDDDGNDVHGGGDDDDYDDEMNMMTEISLITVEI